MVGRRSNRWTSRSLTKLEGDSLTTSRKATAAAPIQAPPASIIPAILVALRKKNLQVQRVVSPPAHKTGWKHRRHTLESTSEAVWVLALPAPAVDAHFFETAFGFPAKFSFG